MNHPIHRITSVEAIRPYTLRLKFADGLERTINFEPMLAGEIYGALRDPAVFAQVRLDPEVHTVVWPSGADFDPATLHDWPGHEAAFHAAAQRWKNTHALAWPRDRQGHRRDADGVFIARRPSSRADEKRPLNDDH